MCVVTAEKRTAEKRTAEKRTAEKRTAEMEKDKDGWKSTL